jgi:hypothetical protein
MPSKCDPKYRQRDGKNVRLLSICPPDALRPCFQEGYLAGTGEVTTDYALSKDDLRDSLACQSD